MKKIILLIGIILAFSSCQQPTEESLNSSSEQPIQFITSIQTRASVETWQEGDTIGVFQILSSESDLSSAFRKNVPHIKSESNASFVGVQSPLYYPKDDSSPYDFVAYYPYQAKLLESSIFPIHLPENANRKADLLYAKVTSQTKDNVHVPLKFKHRLSYLQVNVEAGNEVESLEGLKVSLTDIPVNGKLDLSTNELTVENESLDTIFFKTDITAENNKHAVCKSVLLPTSLSGKYLIFSHPLYGRFLYKFKDEDVIKEGKSYKFHAQLSKSGTIHGTLIEVLDASIEGWGEDVALGDTIEDNFSGIQNDGSKAHPYTIKEILLLSQRNQVKNNDRIRGYPIGICTTDGGEFKSDFYREPITSEMMQKLLSQKYLNRVLGVIYADNNQEADHSKMVVVTLSTADDTTIWNKAAALFGLVSHSYVKDVKVEPVSDFGLHLYSVKFTGK